MTPSDDEIERALEVFNGGLVHAADTGNERGYTTYYRPKEAMRAALANRDAARDAEVAAALEPFANMAARDGVAGANMHDRLSKWFTVAQMQDAAAALAKLERKS